MILHTTTRTMSIVALSLVATVAIVLAIFHLFRPYDRWVISGIVVLAGVLGLMISMARLRRSAERNRKAKATRDSLLKHLWELRHRREW